MTLCHCDKDPDYEAKARFEPAVTLDVTPRREPGEWQPEHLVDIDLDGPVEGLVVECSRCGWTEDGPTLVEVGELDWPERLIEILGRKLQTAARRELFADFCETVLDDDPEPDARDLLERIEDEYGEVSLTLFHGGWVVDFRRHGTRDWAYVGSGVTVKEAASDAWDTVQQRKRAADE